MRVVMEATLDIEPLFELLAFLCIIDVVDELVDPVLMVLCISSCRVSLSSKETDVSLVAMIFTRRVLFLQNALHPLGGEKIPRLGWRQVDTLFAS